MMMYHSHSQRLREQGVLPAQVEPEALDASFPPSLYSLEPRSAFVASAGCTENHLHFPSTLYPSPPPQHPCYDVPSQQQQQPLIPTFPYDPNLDSFNFNPSADYSATSNYSLYSATPQPAVMAASSGSDYDDSTTTLEHRRGSSNSSTATTVYGGPSYSASSATDHEMLYLDEETAATLQQSQAGTGQGQHDGFVGWKRGREEGFEELEGQQQQQQQQGLEAIVGDDEDWRYHQQQHKRYRASAAAPPPPAPVTPPSSTYPPRRAFTDPAPRYHHHPQHSQIAPVARSMSMSVSRTLSYDAPAPPPPECERTIPRSLSYDGVLPASRYPIARPASPTQPVVLKKFTLPASPAMSTSSSSFSPRMELESAARFEPLVRSGGWEDIYSIPSTPRTSCRRGSGEEGRAPQQQQLYSPISPPHHLYPAPPPQQVGNFYPPPSTPATSTTPLTRFPPASASSTLPLPEEPVLLPINPPRQLTTTSRRKISPPNLPGSVSTTVGWEPALPTLPGRRPSLAPRPIVQQSTSVQVPPPVGATVVLPSNPKGRPTTLSLTSPSLPSSSSAGPIEAIHPRFNGTPAPVTKETEKVHPCEFRGCGKMFRRLEHLKRHERSHTQERPYGCEACGKWFSRSDNLAQHKKTHAKTLGSSPPPQGQPQSSVEPIEVPVAVPGAQ